MTTPPPAKGREYAVQVTASYAPGTMGHLVHSAIKPFHGVFGDFASGRIGAHYEEIPHLLSKPVSDANIKELATGETAYWRSETGKAYWAGLILSAEGRACVLRCQHAKNAQAH